MGVVEVPGKAQVYLKRLEQRPQPGVMFERFCDSFLTERSAAELGAFLAEKPEHALLLALWQRRQFQLDAARQTLLRVLESLPGDATALEQLAEVHLALKDPPSAVAVVDRLLAVADLDEAAREKAAQLRARCLWKAGRGAEAVAQWHALLATKPGDVDLQESCLEALEREGRWDEVVKQLRAWLPETRDAVQAMERRLRLARAHVTQNQPEQALEVLKEALAQSAADSWLETETLVQIESVFRRKDDVAGLSALLETLRKANPARVLLGLRSARVLGERGKVDEAVGIHRDLLSRVPGSRELREEIAVQLMDWRRWPEAGEQWQHLVSTYPRDAMLRLRLAEMQGRAGKADAALVEVRAYVQLQQGSEAAWLQGAQVLGGAGAADATVTLLEEAGRALPQSLDLVRALGEALTRSQRGEQALPLWLRLGTEGGEEAVILAVNRLRAISPEGARQAWALLLKREDEFASRRRYLLTLCDLALATQHGADALPRALNFVRLSTTASETLVSAEWAVNFLRATNRLEDALDDWEAIVGLKAGDALRSQIMHALAAEMAGRSQEATALLAPDWDKVKAESGSRLSPESALVAHTWLRLLTLRRDAGRAAAAMEVILSHTEERSGTLYQNATQLWEQAFQSEKALATAEQWRAFAAGNPAAWTVNARLLKLLGRREESLSLLQQAARRMEADPGALSVIAVAQQEFGDPREGLRLALALYDRATGDEVRLNSAAQAAKAALMAGADAHAELVTRFRAAYEKDRARALPALALYEVMRADPAVSAANLRPVLEAAVRAEPRNPLALLRLAQVHQTLNEWSQAVPLWRRLADLRPDPDVQKALGKALVKAGDLEEGMRITLAISEASGAAGAAKGSVAATGRVEEDLELADLLVAAGRSENAARVLEGVKDFRAQYVRAVALVDSDQVQPAIEALLAILALPVTGPPSRESFWQRHAPPALAWRDALKRQRLWAMAHRSRADFERHSLQVDEQVPLPADVHEARTLAFIHLARLAGYLPVPEREQLAQRALLLDSSLPMRLLMKGALEPVPVVGADPAEAVWACCDESIETNEWCAAAREAGRTLADTRPVLALAGTLAGARGLTLNELEPVAADALQRYTRLRPDEQREDLLISNARTLMVDLARKAHKDSSETGRALVLKWAQALEPPVLALVKAQSKGAGDDAGNLCSSLVMAGLWDRALALADVVLPALRESWAVNGLRDDQAFAGSKYSFPLMQAPQSMALCFAQDEWSNELMKPARAPTEAEVNGLRDPLLRCVLHYLRGDVPAMAAALKPLLAAEPQNLNALWMQVLLAMDADTGSGASVVEPLKAFVRAPCPPAQEGRRAMMIVWTGYILKDKAAPLLAEIEAAANRLTASKNSGGGTPHWWWWWSLRSPALQPAAEVFNAAFRNQTAEGTPRASALTSLPPPPAFMAKSPVKAMDAPQVVEFVNYLLALVPRTLAYARDDDLRQAAQGLSTFHENSSGAGNVQVMQRLQTLVESGQVSVQSAAVVMLYLREPAKARPLLEGELRKRPFNAGLRRLCILAQLMNDPAAAAATYLAAPDADRGMVLSCELGWMPVCPVLLRTMNDGPISLTRAVLQEAARRGESLSSTGWIAETFSTPLWGLASPAYGEVWCAPYRIDISLEERAVLAPMLAIHDEACLNAIRIPGLSLDAFAMLAGSRMGDPAYDAEALSQEARRALQSFSQGETSERSMKDFATYPAQCRWLPQPAEYLVWHAWKRGRLDAELPDILEAAGKVAGSAGVRQEAAQLARLLSCAPARFMAEVTDQAATESYPDQALNKGLEAWALRGCDVDLTPLMDAKLKRAQASRLREPLRPHLWGSPDWLGAYVGMLDLQGKHSQAESLLLAGCVAFLGPEDQWVKPGDPLPEALSWISPAEEFLQAAVQRSTALLMPALRLRYRFVVSVPDQGQRLKAPVLDNWLPAYCLPVSEAWRQKVTPQQLSVLLDGLDFVAADPPRPWLLPYPPTGDYGRRPITFLEVMANYLGERQGLRLQLSTWRDRHPRASTSPGPDLFLAVARKSPSELLEALVRWQDALVKMPADVLGEWAGVIDRVLADTKAPKDALAERAPRLFGVINQARLEKRKAYAESILKARKFSDIDPGGRLNHSQYEKDLVAAVSEVLPADPARAQALIMAGLHLMDQEWMAMKWQGRTSYNGWTGPSDVICNWMEKTRDLGVLAASINVLGARDEKALTHAFWPHAPSTFGALTQAWQELGKGKGLAQPPAERVRSLIKRLDGLLAPGPAPLLWFSFYEWADKGDPGLRYDLGTAAAALRGEPGRTGECAQMLEVALAFRRLTIKPTAALTREADTATVRTWFQAVMADPQVNPVVKFGLTHYLMNRLHKEMGRSEVLRAAQMATEVMQGNVSVHGWTYLSVVNGMLALPVDDEWKAAARALVEAWRVRSKFERQGSKRAFDPVDPISLGFVELGCRCYPQEDVPGLLALRSSSQPQVAVALSMLRGGHAGLARNYLAQHQTSMQNESLNGLKFEARDLPALKQMLEGMPDEDQRLYAEVLMNSLAGSGTGTSQLHGWSHHAWDLRMAALAERWLKTKWADKALKEKAFAMLVASPHAADALFQAMSEDEKNAIMARAPNASTQADRHLADVLRAWDLYATRTPFNQVRTSPAGEQYFARGGYELSRACWERLACYSGGRSVEDLRQDCAVTRDVLDELSSGSRDDEVTGTLMSMHACLVAAADDGAAEQAWRDKPKRQAKSREALRSWVLMKKEVWASLLPLLRTADDKPLPVDRRVAIVTRLLADPWVQEVLSKDSTVLARLSEQNLLSPEELCAHAEPLVQAFPCEGRTAAGLALMCRTQGKTEQAVSLMRQALDTARKAEKPALVTEFTRRLAELEK